MQTLWKKPSQEQQAPSFIQVHGTYSFYLDISFQDDPPFHNSIISLQAYTKQDKKTPLPIICKWHRVIDGRAMPLESVQDTRYEVSAHDIGYTICASVRPSQRDTKEEAYVEYGPIQPQSQLRAELEKLLATQCEMKLPVELSFTSNNSDRVGAILTLNPYELKFTLSDGMRPGSPNEFSLMSMTESSVRNQSKVSSLRLRYSLESPVFTPLADGRIALSLDKDPDQIPKLKEFRIHASPNDLRVTQSNAFTFHIPKRSDRDLVLLAVRCLAAKQYLQNSLIVAEGAKSMSDGARRIQITNLNVNTAVELQNMHIQVACLLAKNIQLSQEKEMLQKSVSQLEEELAKTIETYNVVLKAKGNDQSMSELTDLNHSRHYDRLAIEADISRRDKEIYERDQIIDRLENERRKLQFKVESLTQELDTYKGHLQNHSQLDNSILNDIKLLDEKRGQNSRLCVTARTVPDNYEELKNLNERLIVEVDHLKKMLENGKYLNNSHDISKNSPLVYTKAPLGERNENITPSAFATNDYELREVKLLNDMLVLENNTFKARIEALTKEVATLQTKDSNALKQQLAEANREKETIWKDYQTLLARLSRNDAKSQETQIAILELEKISLKREGERLKKKLSESSMYEGDSSVFYAEKSNQDNSRLRDRVTTLEKENAELKAHLSKAHFEGSNQGSSVTQEKMQSEIHQLSNKEKILQSQLQALQENITKLDEERKALEFNRNKMLEQNDSLQEEITILKNQVAGVTTELESLAERKKILEAEVGNMKKDRTALEQYKHKLSEKLKSMAESIKISEKSLRQSEADSRSLKDRNEYLDFGHESRDLRCQLSETEEEARRFRDTLQMKKSQIEDIKARIAEAERETIMLHQLEQTVKRENGLQAKSELAKMRADELHKALEEKEEEIRHQERELEAAEKRLERVMSLVKEREDLLDVKEKLVEMLQNKVERAETRANHLDAEAKLAQDSLKQKEQLLASIREEIKNIQKSLEAEKVMKTNELARREHLEAEIKSHDSTLKRFYDELTAKRLELETLAAQRNELENEIVKIKSDISEYQSGLTTSQEKFNALTIERGSQEKDTAVLEDLVKFLRSKHTELKSEHDHLLVTNKNLTSEVAANNSLKEQLTKQLAELKCQLSDLTQAHDARIQAFKIAEQEVMYSKHDIEAMENEAVLLKNERQKLLEERNRLAEAAKGIQSEVEQLSLEEARVVSGLKNSEINIQRCKKTSSQLEYEQRLLLQQTEQLKKDIANLEGLKASLLQEREGKTLEFEQFKKTVQVLVEKKVALERDHDEVSDELENLAWQISQKKETISDQKAILCKLKERQFDLEEKAKEYEQTVKVKDEEVTTLRVKVESAELALEEFKEQFMSRNNQLLELKSEYSRAGNEIESMENELKVFAAKRSTLFDMISAKQKEEEIINQEISAVTENVAKLLAEKDTILKTEAELSEILAELRDHLANRQKKAQETQEAIQELQDIIDHQTVLKANIEKSLPERKLEYQEYENRFKEAAEDLEISKKRYFDKKAIADRYKSDHDQLEKEIADLKEMLTAAETEKISLEKLLTQLKGKTDRYSITLLQQINEINGRSITKRMELDEKKHKLHLVEHSIKEVLLDIENQEVLKAKVKERYDNNEKDRKAIESRAHEKELQINKLKQQLSNLDNRSRLLDTEIKRAEKLVLDRELQLKHLLDDQRLVLDVTNLQKSLVEKDREIQRLHNEIESLKRDLEFEKAEVSTLSSATKARDDEVKIWRREMKEKENNLLAEKTALTEKHRQALEAKEVEINQLIKRVEKLQASLDEKSEEVRNHVVGHETLKQELSELKEEFLSVESRCQTDIKHLHETLELKSDKIEKLEKRKAELNTELAKAMEELGKKSVEVEKLKQAIKDFREEFVKSEARRVAEIQQQRLDIQEQSELIQRLTERNNVLQGCLDTQAAELKQRNAELTQKTNILQQIQGQADQLASDLTEEVSTLKHKLLLKETEVQALQNSQKNLKEDLTNRVREIAKLHDEIRELKEKLETAETAARGAEALQKHSIEFEQLRQQYEESLRTQERAESELIRLKATLEESNRKLGEERKTRERMLQEIEDKSRRNDSGLQSKLEKLNAEVAQKEELLRQALIQSEESKLLLDHIKDQLKVRFPEIEDINAISSKIGDLLSIVRPEAEASKGYRIAELERLVQDLQAQNKSMSLMIDQLMKTNNKLMQEHSNLMEENAQIYEDLEYYRRAAQTAEANKTEQ